MSVPEPPIDLNKWDLALVNQLINYPSIESETFDFKAPKLNELEIHISAMANTSAGILALGIDEPSTPGQPFVKEGFDPARRNTILNDVGNYSHLVEPHPKIDIRTVDDNVTGKFYAIVKVDKRFTDLPYAIKNKGVFYVRVGASSRPASRNTVLNLFSGLQEKMKDVERLRVSTIAIRNGFLQRSEIFRERDNNSSAMIPPLDLSLFKLAAIQAEWFLVEKGIMGDIFEGGSSRSGMYTQFLSLDKMNTYIQGFNDTSIPGEKEAMLKQLESWVKDRGSYNVTVPFLNDVIKKCEEFLKEKSN